MKACIEESFADSSLRKTRGQRERMDEVEEIIGELSRCDKKGDFEAYMRRVEEQYRQMDNM